MTTATQQDVATLTALLATLKPSMRHVDGRVQRSGTYPDADGSPHWHHAMMREQGLILCGEMQRVPGPDPTHGTYAGRDLVFTRSGTLFYRVYDGWWSEATETEGARAYWTCDPDPLEPRDTPYRGTAPTTEVTPAQALDHFTLKEISQGIMAILTDGMERAREKERALAGRLRNIHTILDSVGEEEER